MKRITYILIVLLVVLLKYTTGAQTTNKLYQFLSEADGKALTVKNGHLSFETERTGVNKYGQLFILKRNAEKKLTICSAAQNSLFLKLSGNDVILEEYASTDDFLWELNYAGYKLNGDIQVPYLKLSKPESNNGMKREGNSLKFTSVSTLTENEDLAGENFRIYLKEVNNTF